MRGVEPVSMEKTWSATLYTLESNNRAIPKYTLKVVPALKFTDPQDIVLKKR